MIDEGTNNLNAMYSGAYKSNTLKQDLSNGGKGYKINAKQAEIIYKNRDNNSEENK